MIMDILLKWGMRDLKAPLMDWRVHVSWLDVAGLVVLAGILLRENSLLWMCVGASFFALVLGVIWLKWRVQREYPFLMIFWMAQDS